MRALLRDRTRVATGAAVGAALVLLLVRVAPDVRGKPLFEDEAIAGQISARPVHEILGTVVWDRGGAPLHFLLVHLAFAVHASADVLRWVSVACALATVLVGYDLGRRLDGRVAGLATAAAIAGSGMLGIYASFGRMYSLLALAGAVAADLFVRAVHVRTARASALAAAGAWLLPAVHPYGGIVVAVEAVVALALWRGRPLRAAVPTLLVAFAAVPFALADERLANRFSVGTSGKRVATPRAAWDQLEAALRGFDGGRGVAFALFLVLAGVGALSLWRRERAFVSLVLAALVAPPVLSVLVARGGNEPDLSPRHLIYALPMWAALVGVGTVNVARGRRVAVLGALAVGALAAMSPAGVRDPRSITFMAPLGARAEVGDAAAWVRTKVQSDDLLFPYSAVYLAGLPQTGRGVGLPRGQARPLVDTLHRARFPVRQIFVAVPLRGTRTALRRSADAAPSHGWIVVRIHGPIATRAIAVRGIRSALEEIRTSLRGPVPESLRALLRRELHVTGDALRELEQP